MKNVKKYLCAGMLAALFGIGIFTLVKPQKSFSDQENRMLTTASFQVSPADVFAGKFQENLSEALSDQFPGREKVLSATTVIRKGMGAKDQNGAYLGKDSYFFEKITDSDINRENYRKNLDRIEGIAKDFPETKFTMLSIPSSGVILKEKLPFGAEIYDAEGLYREAEERLQHVKVLNPTEALTEAAKENQIYYRTDHHWTTKGAEVGYRVWKENHLDSKPSSNTSEGEQKDSSNSVNEVASQFSKVSDNFYGTLYSKTLDPAAIPDSIEAISIKKRNNADQTEDKFSSTTRKKNLGEDALTVLINNEPASMYQYDKLSEKDQYQFFFGGNFGEVRISGGSGEGTVVVLKDSFANCFVPFLLSDYETVIMIDCRYYPGSFRKLLEEEAPEDVLILYELNNFANDTNQTKLSIR